MDEIRAVTLVGVGIMGAGLAAEYAASGRRVTLYARSEASAARGRERVAAALEALERGGVLPTGGAAEALARVGTATGLAAAVAGADLVVESIPEDLALKRALFAELDALCPPNVILATNTSGLPITRIAEGLHHPERVLGTHYLNPPHLMPPVEVIPGERTAPEVVETVRAMLSAMGKAPIVVRREVPGFVWNRLQFAIMREAFWLIEQGVATQEEIDLVLRRGLGRRWSIAGPFASLDLGGIDTMTMVARYLLPELSAATAPPAFLEDLIAAGRYGAKTGAGFYDWPEERLRETIARRDTALLAALRADRAEMDEAGEDGRAGD
ncbi:MAG TPA: 3-hydroxyacyl-CoA dehydrogenase NAD-binding domain-containing protein [Thermomicrobiales bacterium]|nr:3-hydroxyacyl-CoA dehydrogenase NAD-binding domain-containing protein [Thermomicrobiales bacterium]